MEELAKRMKVWEEAETSRTFHTDFPLYARLDGRAFHAFTRGMERPFDVRFHNAMTETTRSLMKEFHANIGYHQSDEISLAWTAKPEGDLIFGGRIFKIITALAAHASVVFNHYVAEYWPEKVSKVPTFDCRACQMPEWGNVLEMFEWRVMDARRNSKSMLAQSIFSHKELQKKGSAKMLDMLRAAGRPWEDESEDFRFGTYYERERATIVLSDEELASIPEMNRPPGGEVVRSVIVKKRVPFGGKNGSS